MAHARTIRYLIATLILFIITCLIVMFIRSREENAVPMDTIGWLGIICVVVFVFGINIVALRQEDADEEDIAQQLSTGHDMRDIMRTKQNEAVDDDLV